jgi:hypothetical protein
MGARTLTLIANCVAVCAGLAAMPAAHAAGTFDGDWNVTLTCPKDPASRSGYTYRFPVEIQQSMLHGEHGTPGAGGWLTLDGTIEPDGSATLIARGLANSPAHANGATPYSYEVSAQFDAASGSGSRTSIRKCEFVFSKT